MRCFGKLGLPLSHLARVGRVIVPLPSVEKYGARRCHAKSKSTGKQCGNPACLNSKSGVCRYHGYRRPETIPRGKDHYGYVNGERSIEGIKRHREAMEQIKMLTKLAKQLGMIK